MNKILIGISGGIDSAAATIRLQQMGYQPTALWIDMLGNASQREKVSYLCDQLGVELIVSDARELFDRQVVRHTLAEHQAGRTVSPCAVCNKQIKWELLRQIADDHAIEWLATGHYVRIVQHGNQHYVARGVDPIKDQSYYLHSLEEKTLRRMVTPLGEMFKTETRHFLSVNGFADLAAGGESQGLCFVERGYNDFLRRNLELRVGEVVDSAGVIVGQHDGCQLFTIGQKRGFTSATAGEVRRIDVANNRIEVGEPNYSTTIICEQAIFRPFDDSLPLSVAVRGIGRNPSGHAGIEQCEDRLAIRLLDDRAWAVAPGQPVVIYCRDTVVGGGVVVSAE